MPLGDIDTSCTLTVITAASRVLSARVAHGNEMPVTLLEWHARKLAVVLLRNASEVRDTCRWLRPALGQGGHCVGITHRPHTPLHPSVCSISALRMLRSETHTLVPHSDGLV